MCVRKLFAIFQYIFYLIVFTLFIIGLICYIYRHEQNYCEMTYMYENPVYHQISMARDVQIRYPRYGLYSYCEGVRCESHRRNQFSGFPVLFIVGNADSYRQVRSLGSVAYRMGDEKKKLDFFSIDFNEELSALFGGVLQQQTEFVAYAIQKILSLYKANRKIILVGNSIGGLLTRAVFLQPPERFNPNDVYLIITQATPHQAPVIHSDSYLVDFYDRVNQYWKTEWNNTLQHLVVLSLAGGDRDHLVRSDLCSLDGLTDRTRSIEVLTSAVPHVWTSTDHRCIVWCRQLVLATTRALLEIIEEKNQNSQTIMQILKRYFLPEINIDIVSNKTYDLLKEPIHITESTSLKYHKNQNDYLIPIRNSKFNKIIIHLTSTRVYLKIDENLKDITDTLLPIPPTYSQRKMIQFNIENLIEYDSIFIQLENKQSQADIYLIENNLQVVELSTFDSQTFIFNNTNYVKLVFPTLTHLWQVYAVDISSNNQEIPLIHFRVPWSNEDLYNLVSSRSTSASKSNLKSPLHRQLRLKLHKPSLISSNDQYASLELYLQSNSSYTLHINSSFLDILSQLIRYYVFLVPTFLFTVLCISYSIQIEKMNLPTYQTMFQWKTHIPIAIFITIFYKIMILFFPTSNFVRSIHSNGYYFFSLPLIVYILALSIWSLISYLIDSFLFDLMHPVLYPVFTSIQYELNRRRQIVYLLQLSILSVPLLSTLLLSGSNGHIALFILAYSYTLWRRTLSQLLRRILTTLLLYHGLLVLLNLTGFVVHVKSLLVQGLYPLYFMMPDPSFLSAIFCIFAFYLRFIVDRPHFTMLRTLKQILLKYNRLIFIILSILSQIFCSYSIYHLWTLTLFIFIHAAITLFISSHRD